MKVGNPSQGFCLGITIHPQTSEGNEGGMVVFKRHVLPMRERGIMRFLLDDVGRPLSTLCHRERGYK